MARRAAAGDHHVVRDAGFAVEIDDDDVFRHAVVQGLLDHLEKGFRGCRGDARRGFCMRYDLHLINSPSRFLRPLPAPRRERICVAERASNRDGKNAQAGGAKSAR